MNEPERFQSGELLSASRLNDALDYSRGQYASVPSADFDVFGGSNANGRTQKRFERIMLVRARENFENRISDCSTEDDVPSGRVDLPRIIPQLNQYEVPTSIRPDFVYDPVAGLSGAASKREGDYFHAVYNEDSGRWEVLSAPSAPVIPAIVNACLGDGWYEVEITDWDGSPSEAGSASASASVSASVSDDGECDLCPLVDTETDTSCVQIQSISSERTTGTSTGEIVYAHTTRLLPMRIGGMIKIQKRTSGSSASQSASASASASVSDDMLTDRLYDVYDGTWPLLALPFPQYDCCTDPVTGEQTVEVVGCSRAIVEGYECAMEPTPCPEASASASV